jgi:transposase-like protein
MKCPKCESEKVVKNGKVNLKDKGASHFLKFSEKKVAIAE